MADNCKPFYKNLNRITSFGEQRYATVQLMNQACMNDEYLKQKVDELTYLSPPAIRKQWSPVDIDEENSWGFQINEVDNTISFNSSTDDYKEIDFTNMDVIDTDNTTCDIHYSHESDIPIATIPKTEVSDLNKETSDWEFRSSCNEHWYVGYDKSKTYQAVSEWVDDVWNPNIPSVCRAQTFTVKGLSEDDTVAKLETVVVRVQYGGSASSTVASPLYVQLRKTVDMSVEKFQTDGELSKKEFKFKSYNPKQYETIKVPDSNPEDALATAVYYPENTTPGEVSITFDNPPEVKNGETYALVFASPLAHYDNAPRIGGWGRKCDPDPYEYGYAFLSENNGYNWSRYGKDDYSVGYNFGKRWPRDFAFRCHIVEYKDVYIKDQDFYLYLNPIHTNPIKSVSLSSEYNKFNQTIEFEVSNTGHPDDWHTISTNQIRFEPDSNGDYRNVLFVRARLRTNNQNQNPYIKKFGISFNTTAPKEMYVRTHFYHPNTEGILGANLWGRVYAPFITEPSTECSVEIIRDTISSEEFTIISPKDLPLYTWVDGLDSEAVTGKTEAQLIQYLTDNPSVVTLLEENNIYVIGFITTFKLNNSPAYPLKGVYLKPATTEIQPISFGEGYDFLFDYTTDELTFHEYMLNNQIIPGSIKVEYNPLFIDGLSNLEVGNRINSETGNNEEGLVLDYFKETFVVTDENIESRAINLRVAPVDPIRSVIITDVETGDETVLSENIDYIVDADNKKLIFEMISTDGVSSRLNLGDIVEVVYTPHLDDAGISIGYHATRSNIRKDVYIEPNYIEYKV